MTEIKYAASIDIKKCPYCAEAIKAEAVVCRFCGRDLTVPVKTLADIEASKENLNLLDVILTIIPVLGLLVGIWLASKGRAKGGSMIVLSLALSFAYYIIYPVALQEGWLGLPWW